MNEPFAHMNVCNRLLSEYSRSARNTGIATSLPILVELLQRQGRLIKFTNNEIEIFKNKHFKKKVTKKFVSNGQDWDYIAVVALSERKLALTEDKNLSKDLKTLPKFDISVADSPEKLDYL